MEKAKETETISLRAKTIFGLVNFPALLSHTGLYCESEILLWSAAPLSAVAQNLGGQNLLRPLVNVLLQLLHLLLLFRLALFLLQGLTLWCNLGRGEACIWI